MIKVDKGKCIGCGLCVSMCPDVFEMDDDLKAKVISQKNNPSVKEAVGSCPVEAITL
ncbi:ferredoxin [Candidatus Pacearchaeota archaeon]|nr:ferredoxin [Candidatus Pacearchaeota archaeon]|tara:strand:- start:167 stop:337 length:171 start_codon:yes stop_codon:yes gene_type:complete